MQEQTCELRFDIPLASGGANLDRGADRGFERAWRAELAAQKMTALAMPPAEAVGVRFRVCGSAEAGDTPELDRVLTARLAALPGGPAVTREPSAPAPGWSGVRVWLSYRTQDLPALLGKASRTQTRPSQKARRGPRP